LIFSKREENDLHKINFIIKHANQSNTFSPTSAEAVPGQSRFDTSSTRYTFGQGKLATYILPSQASNIFIAFEVKGDTSTTDIGNGSLSISRQLILGNDTERWVPIIRRKVTIGEVLVNIGCKVEGFLEDSASEDENQAAATPASPFPRCI
jgi:hypothetical protein